VVGCLLFTACGGSGAQTDKPAGSVAGSPSADATTPAATPVAKATAVAAGGPSKACALVTRQEVKDAMGADPGAGRSYSSHGASQCQYGSYQKGLVLVNLTPTRGKAGFDLMHSSPKLTHVTNVPGVGDRAFAVSGPNTAGIYFDKGDALVVVMISSLAATAAPKAEVLALAKTAAGRM
jgi:Protein of unknown function (DUF3558)